MGIYVVGMHRSGTSALSRTLCTLVGYEADPQPAVGNVEGHWENPSLRRVNDHVLFQFGGDWASPPSFSTGWARSGPMDGVRRVAARSFRSLGSELWVWKDPRLCLTLPFWLDLPQPVPRFVVSFRNPLEVARSLGDRNGFSVPYGLALWERYNRALVENLSGERVLWVSYASLIENRDARVEAVAGWLREEGVADPSSDTIRTAAVQVKPSHRHHDAQGIAPVEMGALSLQQQALYVNLRELDGTCSLVSRGNLPEETPWTTALLEERRRFLPIVEGYRELQRDVELVAPLLRLVRSARKSKRRLGEAISGV